MEPEDKLLGRSNLRIISFAVHHALRMRFARAMARFTSRSISRCCGRGFRVNGLVELLAFANVAVQTNLGSHKIIGIPRRRFPRNRVVLIGAGLALCDGKTYRG